MGKAAVGWVIVAVVDGGCWLLGKGGNKVECGEAGSFLVEALAFETLIDNVTTLCIQSGVRDDSCRCEPLSFSTEHVLEIQRC